MTPKELAAAIRKGHTMIGETSAWYFNGKCGCALGAAIAAIGITADRWCEAKVEYGEGYKGIPAAAALLDAPFDLVSKINTKHAHGMPRLKIADWLDTLPDDTAMPPKVERESDEAYAARMVGQIVASASVKSRSEV